MFHSSALARHLAFAIDTRSFYPTRYPARYCKFTIFVDVLLLLQCGLQKAARRATAMSSRELKIRTDSMTSSSAAAAAIPAPKRNERLSD
jgi:hypothetical protein